MTFDSGGGDNGGSEGSQPAGSGSSDDSSAISSQLEALLGTLGSNGESPSNGSQKPSGNSDINIQG